MRILFLTTSFPRFRGDFAGSAAYELAKELVKLGVRVGVIAPHDKNTLDYEVMDGIEIYRFRYFVPSLQKLTYHGGIVSNLKKSLFARLQLPFLFFALFIKTLKISKKYDLIHAHWIVSALIASLTKFLLKKPCIYTSHHGKLAEIKWLRIFLPLINKLDKIIAVSSALKDGWLKQGIPDNKIIVLPNSIDIRRYDYSRKGARRNQLLYVGRLTKEKGCNYLIEALKLIVKKIPSIKLKFVGDGPAKNYLQKLTIRFDLHHNVCFEGFKPRNEVISYYRESDLFILPSLSEGTPLTILEAMAVGIPIIATSVGGIPEILGGCGILVPPEHPEKLAKAIICALGDSKIETLTLKARKRVEVRYSLERRVKKILGEYKELLGYVR
jgi:glycosyltransferase involved in cell wall biosynthesis